MPRRRIMVVALFLTVATFVVSTVAAEDVPRLTVATKQYGGVQLMTVGIDGSDPKQLTNEPDDATQGAWCPDGSTIAYVVGPRGQGKIKLADADGKNARFLLESSDPQRGPQWSPDGRQLVFSMLVNRNGGYNVFVVNADGSGLKNLTDSNRTGVDPAWSPGGSRIAFVSYAGAAPTHLWVMKSDGTAQADVLGHDLAIAVYPTWTPDGKQINYGGPDEKKQIQVMQVNPDGTGNTVVTQAPRAHSYAAWSPDGQYLAYVSDPGSQAGDLCIYDVLAGEHRIALKGQVFEEVQRGARPAWVPSVRKVLASETKP